MITSGIDLVRIADVADSIRRFGDRYLDRVYTARERRECGDASDPAWPARLAARFAAKEAAFKALRIAERAEGWRAIEITRAPGGWCVVALHDGVAVAARIAGVVAVDVSLTHESDYAGAVAIAERRVSTSAEPLGAPHDA